MRMQMKTARRQSIGSIIRRAGFAKSLPAEGCRKRFHAFSNVAGERRGSLR
jgi:hypothetical protein